MTVGRYALGVAALLVVCGSLGWAAATLRGRFLPDWTGPPARLAEAVVALALLVGIAEALGAVGWLRLAPLTIAAALTALGTHWAVARSAAVQPRVARLDSGWRGTRLAVWIAAAAGVVVIAAWAAPSLQSYDVGIRGFDSLWYHLPFAASFAQTGHITPLPSVDVEYLTQFYPATSELVHAIGIVLLARDTLSPALNLLWLGLSLLAAYCIGRRWGLGPLTLLGAALAFVTPLMVSSQAGSAANDVVGVFFLLAAVALWVNADGSRPATVLAAVAAGLACGTKLTLLGPVAALTIAVIALSPAGRRGTSALLWLVPLAVAGGYWYVRNLIVVGNPLPWTSFVGLLPTPAPPLQQHTGYSIVHYATDTHVWTHVFGPALVAGLGPWWPVVLAATIAGPVLCVVGRGADRVVRALGAVALASLLAYLITPETAAGPVGDPMAFGFNLRYSAPALVLSLTVLPLAPALARRRTPTAMALAALFGLTAISLRFWTSPYLLGSLALALVATAVAVSLARRPPRAAGVAVFGLLLAIVAIGGYPWQRHYLDGRYAFSPGVSYFSRVWALFRHVHDARVGVVGTFGGFFSYPLYGLDLSNRVRYVALRGPHGSFTPIDSCAAWRAAVNRGRFRYLVTAPGRDPWHPKPLEPSPESRWTASDLAARIVYQQSASGQPITVFELSHPLFPAGC